MRVSTKWVVLWSLWAARLVRQPTVPARVSGGVVRGTIAPDGSHVAYVGMPYASVSKEHRFQAPGPEPTWDNIYEAVDGNVMCLQCPVNPFVGEPLDYAIGQEDCLKINVYTPVFPKDSELPVMVYIHGGGFLEGSGTPLVYGPQYLVKKDVILVTFNYRINILGFLNLGIKEAPGNAGMKDQVAALKWVQRNIKVFGGNPNNVTLFGESAGGAAVSHQVLSPMSRGLFHRAIIQSGSSLCPWALQINPVHNAHLLAKTLGFDTKDPYELYEIFNTVPLHDLVSAKIPRDDRKLFFSTLIYAPSIEKKFDGIEPFLVEEPYNLLVNGDYAKVPMINGITGEEGYFFVGTDYRVLSKSSAAIEHSLPNNLVMPTDSEKNRVAKEIRQMYLGDEALSDSPSAKLKLAKYFGDAFMTYGPLAETELLLKSSDKPIYNYVFNYIGWQNFGKAFGGKNFLSEPEATHADDLFYLFYQPFLSFLKWIDIEMTDRMATLWTNFAKYGDPTPHPTELLPQRWLPTSPDDPRAFVLDREFSTVPLWFKESLKYWRDLYFKYRRK